MNVVFVGIYIFHIFLYFSNFYDPDASPSPPNFPKIWGWSPRVPEARFPAPALPRPRNLGEHCFKLNVKHYHYMHEVV